MWVLRAKQLWLTTPSATKSPVPVVMSNIAHGAAHRRDVDDLQAAVAADPPSRRGRAADSPRGRRPRRNRSSSRPPPANRRAAGPAARAVAPPAPAPPRRRTRAGAAPRRRAHELLVGSAQPQHALGGRADGVGHAPEEPGAPLVVRFGRPPRDRSRRHEPSSRPCGRPRPGRSGGPPDARTRPTTCAADPHEPRRRVTRRRAAGGPAGCGGRGWARARAASVARRWCARPSASSSSRSDGNAWSIRPSRAWTWPAVSARTRPCR